MKTSKGLREWRSRQKPGAIMKPSTFAEIEKKAKAEGATDPEAVAGSAYWKTARSKYKKIRKMHNGGIVPSTGYYELEKGETVQPNK